MSVERGNLLYQTGRHAAAQQEYRAALAQEPGNALAHAMIGLCLLQEKAYADATAAAKQAIELRPDWAFGYYTLASILEERERLKEAIAAIDQAIALDPFNPAHLALLAGIRLKQEKWTEALSAADRGLAIDPEHTGCVNTRGIALVHLGRRDEASMTIQGALARDPLNATTHANQGWALLHSGDHLAAMKHFREALRANPELEWAKAGIVEAMKARNPVYRFMLRYFLFMSRLGSRTRWAIILGGWFGYQVLSQYKASNPRVWPYVVPVMIAYALFVLMTWLAAPGFNLMLRINRFGRYALSRDQTVASNWFGGCLAVAIAMGMIAFFTHNVGLGISAILTGLLTIPITSTFSCPAGWPRTAMAAYTASLGALTLLLIWTAFSVPIYESIGPTGITPDNLLQIIAIGIALSSFLANILISMRVRK